jgi:EVE domain
MNAWLGVVSQAHVRRGVGGGFAQVCHGKAPPLGRMKRGDWLVYYSPSVEMGGPPLRAFTALGQLEDDQVFSFDMGGGFVPFRRRVRYLHTDEVRLDDVKQKLELCAAPHWSMALRRGLLPLSQQDLLTLAEAMTGAPLKAVKVA